jgi:hypothetical protein
MSILTWHLVHAMAAVSFGENRRRLKDVRIVEIWMGILEGLSRRKRERSLSSMIVLMKPRVWVWMERTVMNATRIKRRVELKVLVITERSSIEVIMTWLMRS